MRTPLPFVLAATLAVATAGCDMVQEGMTAHTDVVARVDGMSLSVDHAARLLTAGSREVAPAVPVVGDPLTDLWTTYMMVALEYASPDSFADVDPFPVVERGVNQELVWNLRRDAIVSRAEPSDDELRESYQRDQPFTRIKLQHILIRIPENAGQTTVDSLERLARQVWDRTRSGADFGDLARRYSDDPTSRDRGGRMDQWFRRGQLLPELDNIAFGLEPGAVSEPVRSRFGYHILKVTERQSPAFEEARDAYLSSLLDDRLSEMETEYIDSLFRAANPQLVRGAVPLARKLALSPRLERLSPAERKATLVRYQGGALHVGEYADFLLRGSDEMRSSFGSSDTTTVARLLRELVRNDLLTMAARQEGYALDETQTDSLRDEGLRYLLTAATLSGFERSELQSEGAIMAAVDRAVREVLARERSPDPIRGVAAALRHYHDVQVYPERFPEVARRLAELRARPSGSGAGADQPGPAGDPAGSDAGGDGDEGDV